MNREAACAGHRDVVLQVSHSGSCFDTCDHSAMTHASCAVVHIIGGGPSGLMAAEVARAAGVAVELHERMGSVGRKFLVAGKGGLNLTHSDPRERFNDRFGGRRADVARWLEDFDAQALREWARGLGVETFVGSSGRVFPMDLKAAPLLRRWVQRLRDSGVKFNVRRRWTGWDGDRALRFETATGEIRVAAAATILTLGGGSWSILGSDGAWVDTLRSRAIDVAELQPSNCGFDVAWSAHLRERFAGAPIKPVALTCTDHEGSVVRRQGEFVITRNGVEGSLVYSLSSQLRNHIADSGPVTVHLDLVPGRELARLERDLGQPRGSRSRSEHLRRKAGIDGAKAALVHEIVRPETFDDPTLLAASIKALPIVLQRPRPLDEAISTAGGVRFEALDRDLMLRSLPGTFCAGEMLDWEAPTGGYLLSASMASGRIAGAAAARWVTRAR